MIQDFRSTLRQDFIDLRAAYRGGVAALDPDKNMDTIVKVMLSVARILFTLGMVFGALLTLSAVAFGPFWRVVAGASGVGTFFLNRECFIISKNLTAQTDRIKQITESKKADHEPWRDYEARKFKLIAGLLQNEIIEGTLLRPVYSWCIKKVEIYSFPAGERQPVVR